MNCYGPAQGGGTGLFYPSICQSSGMDKIVTEIAEGLVNEEAERT